MKKIEPESLAEIIDRLRTKSNLSEKLAERSAIDAWREVVGSSVDSATILKEIRGKVLLLRLSSPSLRQEISMHRSVIVEEINSLVGKEVITDLKFI